MPCWLPDFARCQRCRCGMAHLPASRWRSCGGWRMSHGGELFASADITSRPGFELVRRGYDKPQVDQYVSQVGSMISRLAGERELALSQIQDMAAQLQRLQAEVNELRKRPVQVDRASFRHLGAMVDQILALAEKQAEAITSTAAQRAANRQAEAEKVLVEGRERARSGTRPAGGEPDQRAEHAAARTGQGRVRGAGGGGPRTGPAGDRGGPCRGTTAAGRVADQARAGDRRAAGRRRSEDRRAARRGAAARDRRAPAR